MRMLSLEDHCVLLQQYDPKCYTVNLFKWNRDTYKSYFLVQIYLKLSWYIQQQLLSRKDFNNMLKHVLVLV